MAEIALAPQQGLQQQQTITPQMQQSLHILQAATLELNQIVQQELLENPTLESETQEESLEDQGLEDDSFEEELAVLSEMEEDYQDYLAQDKLTKSRTSEEEEKRAFMLDSVTFQVTLQEHLVNQLGMAGAEGEVRECVELLIGMVNEKGFLENSIEDVAFNEGRTIGPLREAKEILQGFDPPGIGATDLSECLLIQLRRLGREFSLEARIVAQHLDDLAMKRYPLIAKRLGVSLDQVVAAADFISSLNPRPGAQFSIDHNPYVTPDVEVVRTRDGDFKVSLNDYYIPRLRISNTYKDMIVDSGSTKDTRTYIREKIRSGKFLIKSILQRQDTIEKIANALVRHQEEFLRNGTSHLKPLSMSVIADEVGVHETTVSRAVSGKYISTPQGVFEMKYFFTTGYQTQSGESLSNTSVKNALLELIKEEKGGKAFSDEEIRQKLNERGIPIARRTVTKYRKELNILPSHMRRKFS